LSHLTHCFFSIAQ